MGFDRNIKIDRNAIDQQGNHFFTKEIPTLIAIDQNQWFASLPALVQSFLSCFLQINPGEVEALLSRLPCTFRQEMSGVGASLEKRWNFCGFQGIKST